jgi:hypothetical protein
MGSRLSLLISLLALMLTSGVHAGEQGRAVVNGVLRSGPDLSADKVGALKQGELLTIQMRSANWMKVSTATNGTGWVDMLDVKLVSAGWRKRASGFFRWLGGGRQRGAATEGMITVGIRGIEVDGGVDAAASSPVNLARAQPNYTALVELDAYQIDPQTAADYAREQQLVSRQVEPL